MSNQNEVHSSWPISVTVGAFLGFAVAVVWFLSVPGFEALTYLLAVMIGEATVLGFFVFRRTQVQKEADAILATGMLIVVPLLTIVAYSYETAPPEDPPAIQTVVAYLQTVESINGTLTAIPQTVAALEGQSSGPTATALENQRTELESTRNAVSTLPAASLTLTPLVNRLNATVNAITANKIPLTNPTNGQLIHDDDDLLEEKYSPVSVKNIETSVKFYNPYDSTEGGFDFGIIFRVGIIEGSDTCLCYRLQVYSNGFWDLLLVTDINPNRFDVISSGTVDKDILNLGENESNDLRLVVYENDGYFYVNGDFVAKLDVSDRLDAGGVSAAIGMRSGREIPGYVTRYEDFTVWQILDE